MPTFARFHCKVMKHMFNPVTKSDLMAQESLFPSKGASDAASLLEELVVNTVGDVNSKKLYIPYAPSKTIYLENMLKVGSKRIESIPMYSKIMEIWSHQVFPQALRRPWSRKGLYLVMK